LSTARTVALRVDVAAVHRRLDAFLAETLHWRSRRELVDMLERGLVRVNGAPAKKARRLAPTDIVTLEVTERPPPPPVLAPPLSILFEDDALVVVDKPAPLAVHPSSTSQHDNLLARLHAHYGETPSIIHRLDRGTSGVIALARRRADVPFYMAQFERRTVRKHYVAIVHGHPADRGRIDLPLAIPPGAPVLVDPGGRAASTTWEVVARTAPGAEPLALVRIALHTGRKHQIRVHFAAIGHPLVFDDLYGRTCEREQWPADARPQLHAARLELDHRGARMVFEATLPASMSARRHGMVAACGRADLP
jgi:23S rRNA pseudouridine1911/1915/1917 synthase